MQYEAPGFGDRRGVARRAGASSGRELPRPSRRAMTCLRRSRTWPRQTAVGLLRGRGRRLPRRGARPRRRASTATAQRALRADPARRGGHLRRARRARRTAAGGPRGRHVLRALRPGAVRAVPPRRRRRRDRELRRPRRRATSAACSRSKGSVSDDASDDLREELAHDRARAALLPPRRAVGALPRLRRLASARTAKIGVHLDLASAAACRGAPSRCCAISACAPRSAPTAGARSTRRRATSCTSPSTSTPLGVLRDAGVLSATGAPLEAPPKRVVGRSCCRGAYLRGALLGAGSLSGPRGAHLELRAGGSRRRALHRRRRRAAKGVDARGRASAAATRSPTRRATRRSPTCSRSRRGGDRPPARGARRASPRLRAEANRLANADEANLERTARAAHRQLEAIRASAWTRFPQTCRDRGAPAAAPVRLAGRARREGPPAADEGGRPPPSTSSHEAC